MGAIKIDGKIYRIVDVNTIAGFTTVHNKDGKAFCLTYEKQLVETIEKYYYNLFDKDFTTFLNIVGIVTVQEMLRGGENLHSWIETLSNDKQEWCNYCGVENFLDVDRIGQRLFSEELQCTEFTLAFELN